MIARTMLNISTFITLVCMVSHALAADSITLKSGNLLSGNLIDSEASGIFNLTHLGATDPIKIKESSVERVIFETSESSDSKLTESIQLVNGDHFPCTISELNDKVISFQSENLGSHTISRDKVSQIKFNTKANKAIYQGPGGELREWTTSTPDWKLQDGILSTLNRSDAAKLIPKLTENYILEFKTTWGETAPHMRVCFSSNTELADRNSDYYYIDLNSHGISIYRSNKGKYTTLTQVLSNDEMYGQSNLHVAIHVDRINQKMALYLNGKFTKIITDPAIAPKGSYLIIKSLQRPGVLTQVSEIKINSWQGKVAEEFKSKLESLSKHDLITDIKGTVITGQILDLANDGEKVVLNFKAPFAKVNSMIQGNEIDLLEFKTTPKSPLNTEPYYHLNLASGGLISFSSSQMINGNLTVEHPLLGKVSLPKTSLSSIVLVPQLINKSNPKL